MKTPEVMKPVFSLDHLRLTRAERWFAHAKGCIRTAEFLFKSMDEGALPYGYFEALPAASQFSHGVELFVKGAIANAGVHVDRTHNLEQLYQTYRNRYSAKVCAFSAAMENFVRQDPAKPYSQFLRYPERETGATWEGNDTFDIALWHYEVSRFAEELPRLIKEVLSRKKRAA